MGIQRPTVNRQPPTANRQPSTALRLTLKAKRLNPKIKQNDKNYSSEVFLFNIYFHVSKIGKPLCAGSGCFDETHSEQFGKNK
jgi:hypothetical protein